MEIFTFLAHRFYRIFSTKITFLRLQKSSQTRAFSSDDVTWKTSASNQQKTQPSLTSRPAAPTPKFQVQRVPPTHKPIKKKKSSCRWHTHTHTEKFLCKKLLCHGDKRLYICIRIVSGIPPKPKKNCQKNSCTRFFFRNKTKTVSDTGFRNPAGGFRQKPWRHVRIWMRLTRAQS